MVEVVGEADYHQYRFRAIERLTLCPSGLCPNAPAPPPSNTGVLLPILLLLLLELCAPLAEPDADPEAAGILRGTVCVASDRGKGGGDLVVYDILGLERQRCKRGNTVRCLSRRGQRDLKSWDLPFSLSLGSLGTELDPLALNVKGRSVGPLRRVLCLDRFRDYVAQYVKVYGRYAQTSK